LDLVKSLNILALDSAANACSVAISVNNNVCAARFEFMERGQAQALAPMVAVVVEEARQTIPCGFADLDAVAVTVGPGTFTGIRIGLALAQAIALPLKIPVLGLSTFDAIRFGIDQINSPLMAVIETKRDDFYLQMFDRTGTAMTKAAVLSAAEALSVLPPGPIAAVGDGAGRLGKMLAAKGYSGFHIAAEAPPIAANFIGLAVERFQLKKFQGPAPIYLKAPSVTVPPNRLA